MALYVSETPKYISKEEFALYDLIKLIGIVSMVISVLIITFGKSAKWAVWKKNPEFTHKVFKFSCIKLALIALLGMYCGNLGQQVEEIIKHHRNESTVDPVTEEELAMFN